MQERPIQPLRIVLIGVALVAVAGTLFGDEPPRIDFAHDILPVLRARCAECHTNGKYKGSLSLDTREELLKAKVAVPGKSGESELLKRVTSRDPDVCMPPKGPPLSDKEVALLR